MLASISTKPAALTENACQRIGMPLASAIRVIAELAVRKVNLKFIFLRSYLFSIFQLTWVIVRIIIAKMEALARTAATCKKSGANAKLVMTRGRIARKNVLPVTARFF